MILNVLYFKYQEMWIWEETRRIWQFLYVYLTTASGMQQRANTLKQGKGVRHSISLKRHIRNFAMSEVTNFSLKSSLIASLVENALCDHESTLSMILDFVLYLHRKGLILRMLHFIDLTLSMNAMQLFISNILLSRSLIFSRSGVCGINCWTIQKGKILHFKRGIWAVRRFSSGA